MHLKQRPFPLSVSPVNQLCGVINSVCYIKQRSSVPVQSMENDMFIILCVSVLFNVNTLMH